MSQEPIGICLPDMLIQTHATTNISKNGKTKTSLVSDTPYLIAVMFWNKEFNSFRSTYTNHNSQHFIITDIS